MSDTDRLLRDYAEKSAEGAFRELVSRYVDLVYSVAFRRTGGDAHLAEDVVQTVFADLARKARSLKGETLLGGWLHRHTCFVSSTLMRGERRRRERERKAIEMNTLLQSGDSPWQEIGPVLDEAVNELDDADRQAVLLRFFEKHDLRSIGAALGTNEDAAQKRVSRALDKLRVLLAKRGVSLSLAALATFLGGQAVLAAPAGLAAQVSNTVLASAAAGVGFTALLLKLMTPTKLAIAFGVAAVAVFVTPLALRRHASNRSGETSAALTKTAVSRGVGAAAQAADQSQPSPSSNAAAADTNSAPGNLRLSIVAADSGKPLPNVPIDYRGWEGNKFTGKKLTSNREGVCELSFPAETTTDLQLTTRLDGFADTRLHWRPDRGEKIPSSYALRIVRPVRIGGRVVDPDGQPVAGAKVGFNHDEDPANVKSPENHEFGWIEVATGPEGRWSIDRIAPEMIHRLHGGATHPDYANSEHIFVNQNKQVEEQLRQGNHTFKLGRAVIVRGTVVDADGMPVRDAKVRVGRIGESGRRETTSEFEGAFVLRGCQARKNLLSADAPGFSATTPGHHPLARVIVTRLSPTSSSSQKFPLTEVDIPPGETTTVTLGASNYTVRVLLRWPDGVKRGTNWHIFASIHTPFAKPPAEIINNPEAVGKWWQTPEIRALAASTRSYPLTENRDGSWSAEDIAPGEYALDVNVTERSPAGGPNSVHAHAETTVTVPTDLPSGTLDLGEIVLQASR